MLNTHKLNNTKKNILQIPIKTLYEEHSTFINLVFRPQLSQKFLDSKVSVKSTLEYVAKSFNLKFFKNRYNQFIKEFLKYPYKFTFLCQNIKKMCFKLFLFLLYKKFFYFIIFFL